MPKKKPRWEIVKTLSAGYGIAKVGGRFPFASRFGLTRKEAIDAIKKLDSGRYRLELFTGRIRKIM